MKLPILLSVLLLNSCALYDAYTMTKYDPNEYKLITEIRSDAQQAKTNCSDSDTSKINAVNLSSKTHMFVLYSEHVPKNKDVIAAGTELDAIAQGLSNQYTKATVSAAFCRIKFENIEKSADYMQKVIGARPR
jgi:hypothetical protein